MHTCLYSGSVAHVRRQPVVHRFRNRIAMAYLDLDEAADLVRASRLTSSASFAPLSFRATDHAATNSSVTTPSQLAESVREEVARSGGVRPVGPVRLLTQFRHWGTYFSPLNLFYCFAADGRQVEAVVAEVSNTPWNERRRYVLDERVQLHRNGDERADQPDAPLRFRHAKDFHVSPFMGMNARYDWRLTPPGERLGVHIRSTPAADHKERFDATMALQCHPWNERSLAALALRFPVANLQILAAIYWQALRLWTKRCPYFPHPGTTSKAG